MSSGRSSRAASSASNERFVPASSAWSPTTAATKASASARGAAKRAKTIVSRPASREIATSCAEAGSGRPTSASAKARFATGSTPSLKRTPAVQAMATMTATDTAMASLRSGGAIAATASLPAGR